MQQDRIYAPYALRQPAQADRLRRAHTRVDQSGERDRRGPLRKNGPNYLRWALIEAAHSAGRHPRYRPIVARMRARHGRSRGSKIAAIEIGRRLTEAIWHMLTHGRPFAPAGASTPVAA